MSGVASESWRGRSLPGDGGLEQHPGAVVLERSEASGGSVDLFEFAGGVEQAGVAVIAMELDHHYRPYAMNAGAAGSD